MGLFLLVLFVGGSLAFALRAWANYDEHPYRIEAESDEGPREEETRLLAALVIVTILSSSVSELLRHVLGLSFIGSLVISLGVLVAGQCLVVRFFSKKRIET